MKKIALVLFAGAIAILLAALSSYAQPRGGMMWRGSGGWGPGSQYNRMYDPKAVETIPEKSRRWIVSLRSKG